MLQPQLGSCLGGGTCSALLAFVCRGCHGLRGAPTAGGCCTASSSQP